MVLRCHSVERHHGYHVNIVRLDTGRAILYEQNLRGTSFTPLTDLAPREYRIWVRAVSTTGVISEWGNFVNITITSADPPAINHFIAGNSVVPVLMPDVFEDQGASDIADTSITAGSSITMAAETEIEPEPDEEIALPMEAGKVPQQISGNIDIVMTEWALGF